LLKNFDYCYTELVEVWWGDKCQSSTGSDWQ